MDVRTYWIALRTILLFFVPVSASSQTDAAWFVGNWPGTHYNPISTHTDFVASLKVAKIEKGIFEGITESHLAEDTTVRIVTAIRGRIYNSYMKFVAVRIIAVKHPVRGRWETKCMQCDSAQLNFRIEDDRFIISATNKCAAIPLCQGTSNFSRPIPELNKQSRGSLRRYIAGSANPELQENYRKHQIASTVAEKEVVVTPLPKSAPVLEREKPADEEIRIVPIAAANRAEAAEQLLKSYQGRDVEVQQTIYTGSDSVDIILYDNGVVDDDTVSIIYNGKVVVDKIRLTESPKLHRIGIRRDKKNQLIMFAVNLGTIPPNTALLRIYNSTNEVSVYASSDYNKSYSLIFENNTPKSKPGVAAELFICYATRSY